MWSLQVKTPAPEGAKGDHGSYPAFSSVTIFFHLIFILNSWDISVDLYNEDSVDIWEKIDN